MPDCVVIPELAYRDVTEAVAWLCKKFGFEVRLRIGNHRAQLLFEQGAVIVTQRLSSAEEGKIERLHSVMVRVRDVDAHYACAVKEGVKILRPVANYPYGERQYTAEDIDGHVWTFSQTVADSDPASWGGVLHKSRCEEETA